MMMAAYEHNATIVCLTKDPEAGFVAMQLHSAQDFEVVDLRCLLVDDI